MLSKYRPLHLICRTPPRYLLISSRPSYYGRNLEETFDANNGLRKSANSSGHQAPSTQFLQTTSLRSLTTSVIRKQISDTWLNMADFEAVLKGKYPAKAHARKVVEYIRRTEPNASGVLYLEGQKTRMIEDNDETMPFR